MVQRKNAKITALILTAVIVVLLFSEISPEKIGIYKKGPFYARFCYHFFHVYWVHLFINVWCFLSLVFLYDISLYSLIIAYLAASFIPTFWTTPTIGLSGICFALIGRIAFLVHRKLYFQLWSFSLIGIGFLFSGTNAILHLTCYLAGLLIGLLNKPLN